MKIHLIWAQDAVGGIGKQGKLPWHLSEDLKNFKKITTGHPVIMGRVTWDSLPVKPLPKRRNIVISTHHRADVECYTGVHTCINRLKNERIKEIFIIGGAQIYRAFFPVSTDLHMSVVALTIPGIDTVIPISADTIIKEFDLKETIELSDRVKYFHWTRKTATIPS